jgi:hypothetical protein
VLIFSKNVFHTTKTNPVSVGFFVPQMFVRSNPDPESAPHFVYPNRHNPLNCKNGFLLLAFLPRTKLPLAQNALSLARTA